MGQPERVVKLAATFGAGLVLVSVLLLPWVHFTPAETMDRQITDLISDAHIQDMLNLAPKLKEKLRLEWLQEPGRVGCPFQDPDLRALFALGRERRHLSGWGLWHDAPRVNPLLGTSLLLTTLLAVATMAWKVMDIWLKLPPSVVRKAAGFYGIAAAILLLVLLRFVPLVDTFGHQDDFGLALTSLLIGTRPGTGLWIGLLGLSLMAAAGWGGLALTSVDAGEGAEPSDES